MDRLWPLIAPIEVPNDTKAHGNAEYESHQDIIPDGLWCVYKSHVRPPRNGLLCGFNLCYRELAVDLVSRKVDLVAYL